MLSNITSIDKSNTRISVVTVVRNGIEFVEETILSVLEQTYSNIEYIVIDGLSTDGTVDVIKSYESKIDYWVSEKDGGIADAFNKGLSLATGDYILFLNSDDALANSHVLEVVVQNIVDNDLPTLIYGDCNVLARSSDEVLYRACIEFSRTGLSHGQMLPHPSLFTHRSYFEKYGKFDTIFRIAMDYEWLLRGGLNERIVHVPQLVTNVRDGGVSTLDQSRVVDEIISALKKNEYISSPWGEIKMRSYFITRALAKSVLDRVGLYKVFSHFRNKLAN